MTRKPAIFAIFAVAAVSLAADATAGDRSGLLREARSRLASAPSLSMDVVQTATTASGELQAVGRYTAGRFPMFRLEMTSELAGSRLSSLDVCDEQVLWSVREIIHPDLEPTSPTVVRRDVERIWRAASADAIDARSALLGELSAGGLPGLLAGLEYSFDLSEASSADGVRVLEGPFLKPSTEDAGLKTAFRAGRLPRSARIELDAETLTPRRLTYFGAGTTANVLQDTRFTVRTGDPAPDERTFQYAPPRDVDIEDRTEAAIDELRPVVEPESE